MTDIQDIYSRLLAKGYQYTLFSGLADQKQTKGGRETLATCPLCGKEKHFSYSSQKPVWKCWSCGEDGDWLKYLEKAKGLDFMTALAFLAQEAGVQISASSQPASSQASYQAYTRRADLLDAAQEIFIRDLQQPKGQPVLQYLLQRGYTQDAIDAMELGAYVDSQALQKELLQQGYGQQELKDSGLLTPGFGSTHTLALCWRDPASRAIGIVCRPVLTEDEIKKLGLPKYKYSVGMQKDKGLIGFTSARGSKQVVLLEGVLDALYLNSMGVKSVAVGGTSLSADQIKALEATGTQELLLALDTDQPGQQATEKIIQALKVSKLRPYVVSWPVCYKDPDELVRKAGLQVFETALQQAERASKWLARHIVSKHDITTDRGLDAALEAALTVYTALDDPIDARGFLEALQASTGLSEADLGKRVQEQAQKASRKASEQAIQSTLAAVQQKAAQGDIIGAELELAGGLDLIRSSRGVAAPEVYLLTDLIEDIGRTSDSLSTGFACLDPLFKIPQGALTIVAGRPGQGKTTFQLNLLLNMAKARPDRKFYFFSYEEARKWLAIKLIMILAGKTLGTAGDNLYAYLNYLQQKRGTDKQIEAAIQEFDKLTTSGRLTICDQSLTAEDLTATISYLAKAGEVGAVFVDYIQKIPLQRQTQSQRYLELKRVSELILDRAKREDLAIILGAQLNRAPASRTGEAKRPRLEDLRESGDIEQDASLVLALFNRAQEAKDEDPWDVAAMAGEVDLEISILKNRAGMAGKCATLTFEKAVYTLKNKAKASTW
jgi:DNA primase